jgi:hypothetical protein
LRVGRDRKTRGPREVVGGISSAEVIRQTMPPRGHVEVRERRDYEWRVWYPDEGFVPCAPVCHLQHSHDYQQKLVESFYQPADEDDAVEYAALLAGSREVKVVPFQGIRKSREAAKADRLAERERDLRRALS